MRLLLILAVLSFNTLAETTFYCSAKDKNLKPYPTFMIEYDEAGATNISVAKLPHHLSRMALIFKPVPGCSPIQTQFIHEFQLYIECDSDGDSGYFNLDLLTFPNEASIIFPEGNIGYVEDTKIALTCKSNITSH